MRVEIGVLIFAVFTITCLGMTEVDNLNLLLPQLSKQSPALPLQLITAQGGCYIWESSAPNVLKTSLHEAKGPECSKQAVVQVVQHGPYQSSVYVTATDTATKSVLNIPVRIRRLNKIFIATKSRMMNLKEIQKIELFAQDADLNTFTSLEGLRFTWTLEQKIQIIETVPLAHAQLYLPLKMRQNLEKDGYQSDILVVRALAPGNLKIIARCIEPGYQHLVDEITLSVHQRFQLKPGPILRMVASSSYQLYLERPTSDLISLPQPYYKIKSCSGFQVNSTLYLTVPSTSSRCQIQVEDERTVPPYSSSINVIVEDPTKIKIISEPIIIVGQSSPYTIQFFNGKHQILYGTPKNLNIQSNFLIDKGSKSIKASKKEIGFIKVSLNELKSELEVTAFLPIRALLPSNNLHLPVDETFKLRLLGGSGSYDYSINNEEVGIISGQGAIQCKQVGQAIITVADSRHFANKVVIHLKVSSYAYIKSLEQQKQVNKDDWAHFYIIGKNNNHQTFTQCLNSQFYLKLPIHKLEVDKKANFTDAIKFLSWHTSRLVQQAIEPTSLLKGKAETIIQSFNIYVQSNEIDRYELRSYIYNLENYGICEAIKFRSLVSLEDRALIQMIGAQGHVETKVPLRVYEPLTTLIKDDAVNFLMTPLSSLIWNYSGGSYPWPNSLTKVYLNDGIQSSSKPVVSCPNTQNPNLSYQIRLQNEQTKFLLLPASQSSKINITCKFPKKLELSLDKGQVFDDVHIHANSEIIGAVEPLDDLGNDFFNASNVKYHYTANTGQIEGVDTNFKYKAKKLSDRIKIYTEGLKENINFRRVELQFGVTIVQPIKITHLLINTSEIVAEDSVKKHIQIITLYTPKKPYVLTLSSFSPLLQIKCNESVTCQKHQTKVNVNLLNIGRGFVNIRDKRVYRSIEWIFEFIIVEADQVVVTGDRDYIPEGQSVNISISNYFNGRLISPLLYEDNYLQLNVHKNLKILEQRGNKFLVNAANAGRYEIHGEQGYPRTIKSKNPFVLNVYERIEPDITNPISSKHEKVAIVEGDTTVVIGCKRILRIKGGPKNIAVTYDHDSALLVSTLSSNSFTIVGKKEGIYALNFQVKNLEEIIALIKLKVIVSVIQSVELHSIDEPVVGAQFRILPRFKVGQSEVDGCICDFEYKWSISKQLVTLGSSASLGFLSGGGVNATAVKEGNEIVSLTVEDKITRKNIGQAQKYITILKEIDLNLPTLINKPLQKAETLRISPHTTYYFDKQYRVQRYKIDCNEELLKFNLESGIEASKKTGLSTIKLLRDGHRAKLVEVQVIYVSGILIENDDGFIGLQPGAIQNVDLYFYDNHGRLFVTPMHNLPVYISSSNPDVLRASISTDQKKVVLEGLKNGNSVLSIGLPDRNVFDSIIVSVGSQILPSSDVRVLRLGKVKYSLPNSVAGKWHSSDTTVAMINQNTGQVTALAVGKAKITNGNNFGWIHVTTVQSIEQISFYNTAQGYEITYKVTWGGKNGQEEIPSLQTQADSINNNFRPICQSDNKNWFEVKSQIRDIEGRQRLVCSVKILGSPDSSDFPDSLTLFIIDNHNIKWAKFYYSTTASGFSFDRSKKIIFLSASQPKQVISIRTQEQIEVKLDSANFKYIKSKFDSEKGIQTVVVDMSTEDSDKGWSFDLVKGKQVERIHVSFKVLGDSIKNSHSFISFSMDWPEYLIIIMAVVFAVLCFFQHITEEKLKNV